MKCTGFELLIDFLDGRLDKEKSSRISEHLAAGCQKCEANKQWYERVRSIAASDDIFKPAPWVSKRAMKILEEESQKSSMASRAIEAIAELIYDSLQRFSYAGTRSMESAGREIIYEADNYSIDLQIVPSSNSVAEIVGQILRKDDNGFDSVAEVLVDLTRGETAVWSTLTNRFGEFMMSEVDFGQYDLRIEARDVTLKITGLPVSLSNLRDG
jgi:hypothetical protein